MGELLYGASKRGNLSLAERVREVILKALEILPFDADAAEVYGPLRAQLESRGQRLDEPDLRIASIARARELTLVTGNVRHFARVPGLQIENWLETRA
jgi:tRNA(fMet)-specific endonuclease VapC